MSTVIKNLEIVSRDATCSALPAVVMTAPATTPVVVPAAAAPSRVAPLTTRTASVRGAGP